MKDGSKILMLSSEYPPKVVGGLARHVGYLSRALVSRGHRVVVLTQKADGAPAYEDDAGVEVHRLDVDAPAAGDFVGWVKGFNFRLLERAVNLLATGRRFHLIHAHDWLTAFAGKTLKHGLALPLVATIHATEYGRNDGLHNDLQRYISSVEWWLTYEAWRVICCSHFMEDELQRVFQTPPDKIRVVNNGIVLPAAGGETHDARFRARFAAPDENVIFFLGRLVHEKGVHVLLEAAPSVLQRHPATRFVVAGEGPLRGALEARARELGIAERVIFYGFAGDEERDRFLRTSQVAVFPSLYEPFGIVALEAMSAGTPVVVGQTGGFAEIVRHGQNGLHAVPGDAADLATNIVTLLSAPRLRKKLRDVALHDVKELYSWDTIARQTAAVYAAVLEEYENSRWDAGRAPSRAEDESIWDVLAPMNVSHQGVERYAETGTAAADVSALTASGRA